MAWPLMIPAALLTALLASAPQAESPAPGLAVDLSIGFDGRGKIGRWVPVRLDVEHRGEELDAEVVAEWGGVQTMRALSLPSPSRKRVDLLVRAPRTSGDLTIRLVSRGRAVWSRTLRVRLVAPADPFTLVVTSDATAAASAGADAVAIAPGRLPDTSRAYDAVDRIVWERPEFSGLTAAQRDALTRWQALGGALVTSAPLAAPAANDRLPDGDHELVSTFAARVPHAALAPTRPIATFLLVYVVGLGALAGSLRRWVGAWVAHGAIAAVALAFALVATFGGGRLAGGAVRVREFSIVHEFAGLDAAYVTTAGRLAPPTKGRWILRGTSDDVVLEAGEPEHDAQPPRYRVDDRGVTALDADLRLGEVYGFSASGFVGTPLLSLTEERGVLQVSNRSSRPLRLCRLITGSSVRALPDLEPGGAIDVRLDGQETPGEWDDPGPDHPLLRRALNAYGDRAGVACEIDGGLPVTAVAGFAVHAESMAVVVRHGLARGAGSS